MENLNVYVIFEILFFNIATWEFCALGNYISGTAPTPVIQTLILPLANMLCKILRPPLYETHPPHFRRGRTPLKCVRVKMSRY
jgi:hypothetical protein